MESLLLFLPGFLAVYGLSYHYLFRSWGPDSSSCAISSAVNELALEFSITYFISDMLHLLVFRPSDVLFIAHLAATLFAFLACRYLILHGAYEQLVLPHHSIDNERAPEHVDSRPYSQHEQIEDHIRNTYVAHFSITHNDKVKGLMGRD